MWLATLATRLTALPRRVAGQISLREPCPPIAQAPGDPHATTVLFERLQHVLRLAAECPAGTSGDEIRRAACEMIEAPSSHQRQTYRTRLLDAVRRAEARCARNSAATDHPSPLLLRKLADALGQEFSER